MDTRNKRASMLVIGMSLASILMSGCADGPFSELAAWNPWIRHQWQEDETYAPTFHKRIAELRAIQTNAASLSPAEQERFAHQILDVVQNDANPLLRAEAARTLSALPIPSAVPGLRVAIRDTDKQVRIAACKAWGTRGDMESLETLADVVRRDEDLDVRIAATTELGRFQDPAAVSALGLALNDTDPALQYSAVASLRTSTGRDFGDNVPAWREFVAGRSPQTDRSPSLVERLRSVF